MGCRRQHLNSHAGPSTGKHTGETDTRPLPCCMQARDTGFAAALVALSGPPRARACGVIFIIAADTPNLGL